ncbi:MAG: secretion protein HlyD [Hydrocarboniphaga sp.]|uniref:efflux RND transporter periplasmic adaptor subunit n=1 Tax=Hydrocarboniphaga sp. TaxID=2033016 RepID=UPI00262973D7|nr:efflux RND transporter periplasmic adaptor subunit [Hydrocarboniphaga sp.]MDB5970064.1 secretion protein HlyD [Hydrocarboniphaga sp.]
MKQCPIVELMALIGVAGAALSCSTWAAGAERPRETSKVEWREVASSWPAEAKVEAARQATIEAQVGGRVSELPFDVGQSVRRGQVLVRIEDREARAAMGSREARTRQADAELAHSKAQYERAERVRSLNPDALSESALGEARAAYQSALAAQASARAELGLAVITAPFDGIVARRDIAVGDMAAPGKALLWLYDPSSLRLVVDVPQSRLADVQASPHASIEPRDSQALFEAQRIEFPPAADPRTQSTRVRVYPPDGITQLRPGTFSRVIFSGPPSQTLTITQDAVLRRGEITAAYTVNADGSLSMRQIRVGRAVAGDRLQVLAGLKAGQSVVRRPVEADIRRRSSDGPKK